MRGNPPPARRDDEVPHGLSPRVRGNPNCIRPSGLVRRSIPASAGEPLSGLLSFSLAGVYPRECGGTLCPIHRVIGRKGLSPRVRGNPTASGIQREARRSIPASAGEPATRYNISRSTRVYPRECGGTDNTHAATFTIKGLSPRVRGNLLFTRQYIVLVGSIPASAGEPHYWGSVKYLSGVYPRECGGTRWRTASMATSRGLSPRVRGNPPQQTRKQMTDRSIPASAGEPRTSYWTWQEWRVYPRECGGTVWYSRTEPDMTGLSPRVRGNPGTWGRH